MALDGDSGPLFDRQGIWRFLGMLAAQSWNVSGLTR